jgi:hypothetical protein
VEALDLDVEGLHLAQDRVHQFLILALAEPRVPEHAGRDRLEVAVALVADRLRVLLEDPELELARDRRAEALLVEAREHVLEQRARTRGV